MEALWHAINVLQPSNNRDYRLLMLPNVCVASLERQWLLSLCDTMQSRCSVHQLSSDDACLDIKMRS